MLEKNVFYLYIPSPPFVLGIPQVWELALNSSVCFLISPEKQLLSRTSCVALRICVSGRFYFGDHHSLAFFYPTSSLAWPQHTHRVLWLSPIWAGLWRVLVNGREGDTVWSSKAESWGPPAPEHLCYYLCVSREKISQAPSGHIGFVCFRLILFSFMYVCMHKCLCVRANVCAHACVFSQKPEEGSRFLEVGDTGVHEPPNLDAGMQTLVFMTEQQVLIAEPCLQSQ